MKTVLATLFLVLSTQTIAFADCTGAEALVAGTVTKKIETSGGCQAELNYNYFSSSIMCPLDISDVTERAVEITTRACDFKVGDTVSGVLVDSNNKLVLE
jgi:hypothetical protein